MGNTPQKGKPKLKVIAGGGKSKLDDDIDVLFKLPLAEFIGARKTLSARLKKEGRGDDADLVTTLGKPSVSAWAVNQVYWRHRESFDQLMATGQLFRESQKTGKVADMREALDTRRDVLSELSDLATTVLRDAGHNPSLDTVRRIATTLEAMSAYAVLPNGLSAGRLAEDIDPPGFDSLGAFAAAPAIRTAGVQSISSTKKPAIPALKTQPALKPLAKVNRLEEVRQAKLAAAKASVQDAKKLFAEAQARTRNLEATQKKADKEAREAERHKLEAEERFKKAITASVEATRRSRVIGSELEQAVRAVENAKRTVEKASQELESLFANPR
jgi:hypothetical protein